MKVAFIHNEKKLGTGAHFINDLMASRLREAGVQVKNFYPKHPLLDAPLHLKGISNVLFFYALLEHKDEILKYDLIQGTTYTPLALLPFPIPVVSHFGSTSWGFLRQVPRAVNLEPALRKIWDKLKEDGVLTELNVKTRRPLQDVAEVEQLVASRADTIIATSEIVRQDLLSVGVAEDRIHLVPNAIEDYWFETKTLKITDQPSLIFLGRIGADAFTLKLKGIDRLIDCYKHFPSLSKHTVGITTRKELVDWLDKNIPKHHFYANFPKARIPSLLEGKAGSILLITSRYEGFSLSLIEGMSQGLIPVTYRVGIAPEIIQNGKNGFLVSTRGEARRAIEYILHLSPEDRRSLAKAAQATARKFTSQKICERLQGVYKETLERAAKEKKEAKQNRSH